MSSAEIVVFAVILTAATLRFLRSCGRLARLVRLGKPDGRLGGTLGKRAWSAVEYALFQKRVVAQGYGVNHFVIFWGFLILLFANAEFVLAGLFPGLKYESVLGARLGSAAYLVFDVASAAILVSVAVALFRRLVLKPGHIEHHSREGFIILGLIAGLMLASFGFHGAEIALHETAAASSLPVSRGVAAPLLAGLDGGLVAVLAKVFWWTHALIFLFFLNYLPSSKHLHILTAIPGCFCRPLETVTTAPREEFRPGRTLGVSVVDEFSWKDLLDFLSCTECGRCNANCPATTVGKVLNPRHVIRDGKLNLLANGEGIRWGNRSDGLKPLITEKVDEKGSVPEEALWACTTCGACMAVCPVFIEHVPKIIQMRRSLVENRAKFPAELADFFTAEEQRSNPWGIAPGERGKWTKDLEVAKFAEGADVEYFLYAGCAASFDSRIKKVATALVKSLQAAGVKFGVLGSDERCCGDSLRRLGNEYLFEKFALANVEQFRKLGAKKIITVCPHCFSTLKNDYSQYGLEAEVVHHSDLLCRLTEVGRLSLSPGEDGLGRVVFHDSCYLGRYNKIYAEPRRLIARATGREPEEMDRRLNKSFCCGAGGGRMWMEEHPKQRINNRRVGEALSKNPDTIAVACPYCLTMFQDGLKELKAPDSIRVLDVAEILASRLK